MAADSSVIREFLIALGFKIDEAGVRKFGDGIVTATKTVVGLGAAVAAVAVTLNEFVVEAAEGFEKIYYASQRAGTSAENLKALQYGFSQIGLGVDAATQTLETFALSLKLNPAMEGFLRQIGIVTRDGSKMRDTRDIMLDFVKKLSSMPPWLASQWAQMFGISAQQLFQMQRYAGELADAQKKYKAEAKVFGIDLDGYARDSHEFMVGLRELGNDLEFIWMKVAGSLIKEMTPALKEFHKYLIEHGPELANIGVSIGEAFISVGGDIGAVLLQIAELITKTDQWKNVLIAVALVITTRLFGPLGLVLSIITLVKSKLDSIIQEQEKLSKEPGNATKFHRNKHGDIIGDDDTLEAFKRFFRDLIMGKETQTGDGYQLQNYNGPSAVTQAPPFMRASYTMPPTGGYAPAKDVSGSLAERGNTVMAALMKSFGMTAAQAAGVASNLAAESGIKPINEANPLVRNSRGGFGIAQWTTSRRLDFERFAAENGLNPASMDANIKFLIQELRTKYAGVLRNVLNSKTATDAARAFFPFESGGAASLQYHERDHSAFADSFLKNYNLGGGGGGNARGSINMHQKTDIHVHGGDPKTTAQEVAVRQRGVNADFIRNLGNSSVYA